MKRHNKETIYKEIDNVNKILMKRLKDLRKEKNYKQVDVAVVLDVDRTTYTKMENAQKDISHIQLIQLASLFETTVAYLLGESDER